MKAQVRTKRPLVELITGQRLKKLAGERSFARGLDYFHGGVVERLRIHSDRITAQVEGSDTYTVKLWRNGSDLDYDCTCPIGQDGEFCKHLVATGLTWLAQGTMEKESPDSREMIAVRGFLEAADRQTLVDLLMEQAALNEELAGELLLAAQRSGKVDPRALKETIRDTLRDGGFIDYRSMPAFAIRAQKVPELLSVQLQHGDPDVTTDLAQYAALRALKVLEQADDSDGRLGGIISDIADIHLQAIHKAGIPATDLANRLFDLQLADGYGFFDLESYRRALGKEGLAAYRELATRAWNKLPTLKPDAKDDARDGQRRYQLTEIMKTLARMDGSADVLVAILKRDLTQPYTYLEIAQTLSKAGRHDEALHWAEQGRDAYAEQLNLPLDDFLVTEYHRRKRHDEAIALRWARFLNHPQLRTYQELKVSASKGKSWKDWREQALDTLRKTERTESKTRTPGGMAPWDPKGSTLVEIFLWEGDPRTALETARKTQCASRLWLQLAKALEDESPEDAIAIYKDQVEPIVRMTNNDAYDRATEIIRRVRDLMQRAGKSADFLDWLTTVRAQHKAKRNFIQRLDRLVSSIGAGPRKGVAR